MTAKTVTVTHCICSPCLHLAGIITQHHCCSSHAQVRSILCAACVLSRNTKSACWVVCTAGSAPSLSLGQVDICPLRSCINKSHVCCNWSSAPQARSVHLVRQVHLCMCAPATATRCCMTMHLCNLVQSQASAD